jgi:NAD(P)-dependent dehydrogenase (short-subunit alcohol dehydrogenase family)
MKEFKDKVLVVTGGSSGIGQAIAKEGALRGMKIIINGKTEEHVNETLEMLHDLGAEAYGQTDDISEYDNVQKLFDLTMEKFGRVDMLCNNAGVAVSGPIWEIPLKDIKWITEVNMMSHLYGMHIFIPQMIKQGTEAEIVNTESTAGIMTSGNAIMYHATKHAGVAAAECAYLSLKQRGLERIHVHCLMPAFVQTRIHEADKRRPERFAIDDDPYYKSQEFLSGYIRSERQVKAGIPIDYVGTCVFTAIEDEKFYIYTHPESQVMAGMRVKRMVSGENPQ